MVLELLLALLLFNNKVGEWIAKNDVDEDDEWRLFDPAPPNNNLDNGEINVELIIDADDDEDEDDEDDGQGDILLQSMEVGVFGADVVDNDVLAIVGCEMEHVNWRLLSSFLLILLPKNDNAAVVVAVDVKGPGIKRGTKMAGNSGASIRI